MTIDIPAAQEIVSKHLCAYASRYIDTRLTVDELNILARMAVGALYAAEQEAPVWGYTYVQSRSDVTAEILRRAEELYDKHFTNRPSLNWEEFFFRLVQQRLADNTTLVLAGAPAMAKRMIIDHVWEYKFSERRAEALSADRLKDLLSAAHTQGDHNGHA